MNYILFFCTCITHQQTHIHKYVQLHIIVLHQHVSIIPVTIIRVAYKQNKQIQKLYKYVDKTSCYYT
jgi:hypothetical protein